jgi:hypothetical protein
VKERRTLLCKGTRASCNRTNGRTFLLSTKKAMGET